MKTNDSNACATPNTGVRAQPIVSLSLDDAKAIFRLTENCEAPYWVWNGGAMMACQRLLEAINAATGQANNQSQRPEAK